MLSTIVGVFDWPAAFVLIAFFIGVGSVLMTYITKPDIELQKIRLQNDHDEIQYKQETQRATEMKKIEQNLITSHKEVHDQK